MTTKDYKKFANLFRTWNVGFINRELTLNFIDVY